GRVPGVPGMGQMFPENLRIVPVLHGSNGDDPGVCVAETLADPMSNLAGFTTRLDPPAFREVPQHSPLAEPALFHAPAKRRWKNVDPPGVAVGPMTHPPKPLLGVAMGIELGSMLAHPAPHPLYRPVRLVGRRRRLKVGKHRLGEGHGS